MNFGLIFTQFASSITNADSRLNIFRKNFGLFKKSFYDISRDTKAYGNVFKGIFETGLTQKDITALRSFSTEIKKGSTSSQAFIKTMNGTSVAAKKIATQMASVQLAFDSGRISEEEYAVQMDALRAKMQATSTTAKVMDTVIRTALNVALFAGIEFGVWIIQKLVNAEKEAIEYANEMTTAYKSQKQEVENLRQEYLDIVDSTESEAKKSEELYKWKKKLIQAYGYEKSAIEGVTTARATGLKFFDKEEYDNAIEIINKNNKDDVYKKLYERMYGKNSGKKNYSSGHIEVDLSDLDWLKEYGVYAESLYSESDRIGEVVYKFGDNVEDSINHINDVLAILNKKSNTSAGLTGYEKIIKEHLDRALTDFQNAQKESEDILDTTGEALFTTRYSEFLQKYGNELDKLTKENFDSWKDKFNKYLAETEENLLSDENFVKIRDEYFKNLKIDLFPDEVIAETNKYGYSLTSLSEKLEAFSDITKDVSTKQSTIQSALEKVRAGTSLTSDEMQKLGDTYPDLLGKFEETVDGWTIGADELVNANDKITQSVKDAVDEQKKSLNETIDKIKAQLAETPTINGKDDYNEWQKKQAQLNKDLEDAQNQLQGLDNLVKSFGSDLSGLNDKLKEYNDSLKYCETLNKRLSNLNQGKTLLTQWADTTDWKSDFTSIVNAIVEAFPQNAKIKEAANKWFVEQTEEAARGLVTEYETAYNEDLDNFNTYLKAKFNYADKYSEDGTSWQNFLSANTEFVDEFKSAYDIDLTNYKNWIDARADLQKKLLELDDELFDPLTQSAERERLWKEFTDGVEARFNAYLGGINNPKYNPYPDGDKKGSSSDEIKDNFTAKEKELKHLLAMEKITQEQYYEMLFGSDEYKALLADRTKYRDELNSIDEEFYKYQQNLYKENADKQFDDLEDQYKRGIITAEQYAQGLHDLGQELYGEGSIYGGTEFAIKALEELDKKVKETSEDIYDESLDSLKKNNDGTLKSEEQFIKNWKKLNDDTWKDINPKEWQKNYNEIIDYEKDFYKDLLDNGTYSAEEYRNKIKEIYFGAKGSGIDLGLDWFKSALKEADSRDYEDLKENLASDGDKTLENVRKDTEDLAKKNYTLFHDDPDTLKKNGEEIFNNLVKSAQDALSKGLISPERYLEIIDTFANTWQEKLGLTQGIIDEAKEALEVDDWMNDWDKKHGYDEDKSKNDFRLRQDRIDEYRNKIIETYGVDGVENVNAYTEAMKEADEQQKQLNEDTYAKTKEELSADGDKTLSNILSDADVLWNDTLSLFADGETIKENAKDIFSSVSDALQDALEKGIISADEYETLLRSWGDKLQLTEADITDALVDTYEHRADALQKANDGSLASERKYIADMKALNFSTYGDENSDFYDPTTYASNLRGITDHELDVLGEALKKGEISTREYAEEVAKILDDADVLGADYIAEKQEEIDKIRAEREKQYWEQQKELVEDYYDKQIEELEKIQDEQEKITKAEELRLNLIKARKTLEEAKNNRNQLVFHDGMFEYMSDQDAVMSAEEEVAEAVKAIKDNEFQEQIDLLKSQKDEAVSFYDDMISMIEAYINETVNISESDSETLKKIADSQYSKEWKDVRYGDKTANEVTEEQKRAVEKSDDKSDSKPNSNDNVTVKADSVEIENNTDSSTDIQSGNTPETDGAASTDTISNIATTIKEVGDSLLAFINSFGDGNAFENLVRALGGNPTAEAVKNFQDSYNATLVGKQITPSTVAGVTNNNNSTNNNTQSVVFSGDINVNVELSLQSLDDFVDNKIDDFGKRVIAAIKQKMPAVLAKA